MRSPKLQGPLNIETFDTPQPDNTHTQGNPCNLLCIPSTPLVLVKAYTSGLVEIYLAFDDLHPEWIFKQETTKTSTSNDQNSFVLLEKLDLELHKGVVALKSTPPTLIRDPIHENKFYIFHGSGIHQVQIPWLNILKEYSLTEENLPYQLPELPSSSIHFILDTMPLEKQSQAVPMYGMGVWNKPGVGFILALLTSNWRCIAVDLQLKEEIEKQANRLTIKRPDFANNMSNALPPNPPCFPKLAPSGISLNSESSLRFVMETTQQLEQTSMMYLSEVYDHIKGRLEKIVKKADEQTDLLQRGFHHLSRIDEYKREIDDKIQIAHQNQTKLTEKIKIISKALAKVPPSRAELMYGEQLKKFQQQTDIYAKKISDLEEKGKQLKEESEPTPILTKHQEVQLPQVLEKQQNLIQAVRQEVIDLEKKLEKLQI